MNWVAMHPGWVVDVYCDPWQGQPHLIRGCPVLAMAADGWEPAPERPILVVIDGEAREIPGGDGNMGRLTSWTKLRGSE